MPLFNAKTLKKHIKHNAIPTEHTKIINGWIEQIQNGTLAKLNEIEVHAPFTQQIMCKLLGYETLGENASYTIAREYPIARGHVDLAIGHFSGDKDKDKVFAPFELKGAKTKDLDAMMAGRHKTPVQQAFEYARDIKGAQWVLISNYVELRLYAISETSLVYEQFSFEDLLDPAEYAKFQLLLSADNFLNGKTSDLLKESERAEKDISDKLYVDYKNLRQTVVSHLISDNTNYQPAELIAPAQKLLDRILFISFAEDKGLIPESSIKKAYEHNDPYNPRPIYQNFIGLFNSVDKGNPQLDIPAYNGGLFAVDPQLDSLNVSDTLCEGFKELAAYDFDSEVSVTVLGHIFEQSIADLEALTKAIESGDIPATKENNHKQTRVSGKRKKDGVVYTPDSITQFIVQNTLGTHLDEQFELLFHTYGKYKPDGSMQFKRGSKTEQKFWYAWQENLQKIKVVDPTCGSGAFLVAAFDYLYSEYQKINNKLADLTGQHSVLDLNKEILNNNLFGVDVNEESIEITKLSLWLKTAQRGKPLESLSYNIQTGNSLGFDNPAPNSTFNWKDAFPSVFQEGGFDVVLGNPPYVRQELLGDIKPWLETNYAVYHGVLDLYGYFFELGIKLLKPNGRMAYIASATFFKTGSGQHLREHLAQQVSLDKIIDFGDIQVFEGVTTYPAILVLRNNPPKTNKVAILPLKDKLPDNLQTAFEQQHGTMTQNQLTADSWQLEDERLFALRQKLTHKHPTLKEVYGSPYRGVLTGLNEAFVIDRATYDAIIKQDPQSTDLIKPFLEGKDLKRWHCQPRDLWLIAIPKFWTREQLGKTKDDSISEEFAWNWFKSTYPALANWLSLFETKGKKRGDKGEFWWELRACAYYEKFARPKIFYPDITNSNKFHRDTSGSFSSNTGYFLPIEAEGMALYLNSKVSWFFLKGISDFVRGGFYRMFSQNIEQIPIHSSFEQYKNIFITFELECHNISTQRYQCEHRFRRRLSDLCPEEQTFKLNKKLENWWLLNFDELQKELQKAFKANIPLAERNDWQDYFEAEQKKHSDLNQKIVSLEQQLNQQVYKLFNLTKKEIALIESTISA